MPRFELHPAPVIVALGRLRQSCEFEGSLTYTVRPCFKTLEKKRPPPPVDVDALCPEQVRERPVIYPAWANSELRQVCSSALPVPWLVPSPRLPQPLPPPFLPVRPFTSLDLNDIVLKNYLSEEGIIMKVVSLFLASQLFFRAFCRYFRHFKNYGDWRRHPIEKNSLSLW